jgi:hypothetical protein
MGRSIYRSGTGPGGCSLNVRRRQEVVLGSWGFISTYCRHLADWGGALWTRPGMMGVLAAKWRQTRNFCLDIIIL